MAMARRVAIARPEPSGIAALWTSVMAIVLAWLKGVSVRGCFCQDAFDHNKRQRSAISGRLVPLDLCFYFFQCFVCNSVR